MSNGSGLETNIWFRVLRGIMYALLVTPLLLWSIFLFPFITTKVLSLRVLVEAAVLIYVPLAIKFPQLRPKWNGLTIAVWAYMAILIITSIFGVNFSKSFMGLIGLVQLHCTDPDGNAISGGICDLVPPNQGARISATIGNASFFAAYLLFGIFLSLYRGMDRSEKSRRDIVWGGVCLATGAIFFWIV